MVQDGDWRLTGQERFLSGVELQLARWAMTRDGWDHDHCAFCWMKVWDRASDENEAAVGYTTTGEDHWICVGCFDDFVERFRWTVTDHPDESRRFDRSG